MFLNLIHFKGKKKTPLVLRFWPHSEFIITHSRDRKMATPQLIGIITCPFVSFSGSLIFLGLICLCNETIREKPVLTGCRTLDQWNSLTCLFVLVDL